MILDITLGVLPPDDQMINRQFEELHYISGSSFKSIEPLLLEHISQVLLDSGDGSGSEMVTKNPEHRHGLSLYQKFEQLQIVTNIPDGELHHCARSMLERWDK